MDRILEYLCDAPIGANALPSDPDSPARRNIQTRLDLMERLRARLDPEENAMLDAYFDLEDQSDDDFAVRKFQYGFCLGVSLMLEVLEGRKRLLG